VLFAFQDDDGDGAGDSSIVVKGSIHARGTEGAPIEFAPASPGPIGADGWSEVLIEDAASAEFAWCRFVGGQQAVHAHRTPLVVEDCRFESNGIALRFTGGPVAIRRNRFVANGTAVRYFESSPEVTANEFEGNATAIFVREDSPRSVVTGNNFISSTDYHVKIGESQAADLDARGNWWGTERREEIERLIYDREDAGYLGRVRYAPPASGFLRIDGLMP
jgi:nitrous oxidase accessory protein NosD